VGVLVTAGCSSSGGGSGATPNPDTTTALTSARHFLHTYVAADGRVVRHDQGGDTVSEGQGYALLLAVATHDARTFRTVWTWTQQNLQQQSGLFAYHWQDGEVSSATPASDADVQIAWALDLGARTFGVPSWRAAATRIGKAVANAEIGYDDNGKPVLAAGPWAVGSGAASTVAPGYWTPPATAALAQLTGDRRLAGLGASEPQHFSALTHDGTSLPPDWATLGGGDAGTAIPAPNQTGAGQFGPDAMRALVWNSCAPTTRPLVGKLWHLLAPSADRAPLARGLDGTPQQSSRAPLSAVAAAAAALAAGHASEAHHLLALAQQIDASYPTYYGAAWVALGRVLLTTQRLANCAS